METGSIFTSRWRDRGRVDNAPPPPYEESQRSHQQAHDPRTSPTQLHPEPIQANGKTRGKRHAATSGRRVAGNSVRHRKPIPQRFLPTAYSQQPGPSQPVQVQDVPSGPFDFSFGRVKEECEGEDEAEDEVCKLFQAYLFRAQRCYMHPASVDGLDWGQDFPVDRRREEGPREGSRRHERCEGG